MFSDGRHTSPCKWEFGELWPDGFSQTGQCQDEGQLRGTKMSVTSHTKHGSSLGLLR